MPKVIQVLSVVVPARYFVTILKALFLKGVGIGVIWDEMLFLVIFGALVFWRAARKLNQKVA
jgi:ABC-2 type transport system permease protein